MEWNEAKRRIQSNIHVGTDVNNRNSKFRFIESVNALINSRRYEYDNEYGFIVPIGTTNKINIPWSVLKECFFQASTDEGYNINSFRRRYPLQAKDHPCHVHVIGKIFDVAGLADYDGKKYRIV